jgi:rfaE bifunctional protein nucleotidyltransferase chain/domain
MDKIIHRWQCRPYLEGRGKIVATCGIFDILHVSHKRLLEQAKSLGDVLVIAVNDDESARKIKGEPRPLIPLAERMEMLAAFSFTDYVVAFRNTTAIALMDRIKPDIFVKGGNNRLEDIPEKDVVESNGGVVKLLPITLTRRTRKLVAAIGPSEPVKHGGFSLFDKLENQIMKPDEVAELGIVLTADGRLMWNEGGFHWRDGSAYPEPLLLERDVSKRYGLLMKIATG